MKIGKGATLMNELIRKVVEVTIDAIHDVIDPAIYNLAADLGSVAAGEMLLVSYNYAAVPLVATQTQVEWLFGVLPPSTATIGFVGQAPAGDLFYSNPDQLQETRSGTLFFHVTGSGTLTLVQTFRSDASGFRLNVGQANLQVTVLRAIP